MPVIQVELTIALWIPDYGFAVLLPDASLEVNACGRHDRVPAMSSLQVFKKLRRLLRSERAVSSHGEQTGYDEAENDVNHSGKEIGSQVAALIGRGAELTAAGK